MLKKKYDLDNLLITQGWSSYDWDDIFNNNVTDNFVFEDGIVLKANQNKNRERGFVLYPLTLNSGLTVNLSEDQDSFVVSSLYPMGKEKLGIGTMNKKGKVSKPNLDTEFFPSKIPDFRNQTKVLHTSQPTIAKTISKSAFTLFDMKETQILDEVLIKAKKKQLKIDKLKGNAFSNVYVFDDAKRRSNLTFANYVNSYLLDFYASDSPGGSFEIRQRVPRSLNGGVERPIIYLDDMLISDLNFFYAYNMDTVDYIVVNGTGLGEGFFGAGGVIKIYTSLDYVDKSKNTPFIQFEFPLTFAEDKKFYVPKYNLYTNDFFKEYGVIDWIPNCKVDDDGNLTFTVYNPGNNSIKLFIEGITEKGDLVSEVVVLNKSDLNY